MGNKSSASTAEVEEPEQMSYMQMIKQGYQELVNAIIRPPRCQYDLAHLGPAVFEFCGKTFQRADFELRNPRGHKIVCSMWEPIAPHRPNPIMPCLIYMHGNSSARLEALPQLSLVLSLGATLLSFDFSGSGLSDGDYVSLGAFEKEDLKVVIEYLRSTGTTSTIALWGRSMGAATALLHGERDPSIAGMVLDSSFADLNMLAEEMVEKGRQNGMFAPNFVVKMAIRFIRSSVQKTADFDIKSLSPIEHADKCYIPALFVAAEGDAFVPPHHSQQIYMKYAGDKNVIIVEGDHNSPRPKFLFDSAAIFLTHTLQVPEHWILPEGQKFAGQLPWHVRSRSARAQRGGGGGGDLSHLTLEEVLALSQEEANLSSIGMTAERQADVQSKLYRMLGDRSAGGTSSSSSSSSSSAPVGSGASGQPSQVLSASDVDFDLGMEGFGARDVGEDLSVPVYRGNRVPEREWECHTCTLVNEREVEWCAACGMPRPDLM